MSLYFKNIIRIICKNTIDISDDIKKILLTLNNKKWNQKIKMILDDFFQKNKKIISELNSLTQQLNVVAYLSRLDIISFQLDNDIEHEWIDIRNDFFQLFEYNVSNLFANFRALIDINSCLDQSDDNTKFLLKIIRRDIIIYKICLPIKQMFEQNNAKNKNEYFDTCSLLSAYEAAKLKSCSIKYNWNSMNNKIKEEDITSLLLNLEQRKKKIIMLLDDFVVENKILINKTLRPFFNKWIKHSTKITEEKMTFSLREEEFIYLFYNLILFTYALFAIYLFGSKIWVKNDILSKKLNFYKKYNNKNYWFNFWNIFWDDFGNLKDIKEFSKISKENKRSI